MVAIIPQMKPMEDSNCTNSIVALSCVIIELTWIKANGSASSDFIFRSSARRIYMNKLRPTYMVKLYSDINYNVVNQI